MSEVAVPASSKPYTIAGQPRFIPESDWRVLVILDGCRFDVFEAAWQRLQRADNLQKAVSPAVHTMMWLNTVFPGYYDDIVYYSSSPFVNSQCEASYRGRSFDARKHFSAVVDVWKDGWDESLDSVPPGNVNAAFFSTRARYPGKRFILHYMQPHVPYISDAYKRYIRQAHESHVGEEIGSTGFRHDIRDDLPETGSTPRRDRSGMLKSIKRATFKCLARTVGVGLLWKLTYWRHGGTRRQDVLIYLNEGWAGIRNAYRQNLELALKCVQEVAENSDGKILVTADHGEFLGEHGLFGHGIDAPRKRENTEVPWVEMLGSGSAAAGHRAQPPPSTSKTITGGSEKDEELVQKRLRALGYL